MYVIKADGRREEFNERKVRQTCTHAGATRDEANHIVEEIKKEIYDGITTREIYKSIRDKLRQMNPISSRIYTLRESLSKIEPEAFEIYVYKLLISNGYKCEWNVIVKGASVEHQIDIIAKQDKLYLVECKRHERYERFSGLKTILEIHSRIEDIKEGYKNGKTKYNFDKAWIITNTKFSDHAIKYAKAKDIVLTGWNYPHNNGIEHLITSKKLYPVTILNAKRAIEKSLMENKIITINDLISFDIHALCSKISISEKDAEDILNIARSILNK